MERFEHQHLEPDTIRLFRLDADSTPGDMHLTIQHHPDYADGDVNYVALSYCWGDPTPVADVRLNGQALGIAQNLLDCLKVQHDCSRDTWYWVDAICINQKDVEERNQQVPQMWRIYSAAQYVLSWLGLADDEMARAFEIGNILVAKYGSDVQSQPEPEDITQPPGSYEAAATLFAAEYFRRMWITPETMNARQILLKAGSSSLPWSALYLLPDKSPDQGWENFPWGRLMKDRMSPFMGLMGGPPEELAGVNVLCNALRSNFNKRCSDVRDKIFSLTANPHLRIRQCDRWLKADYRMLPEEVCVMTLAYWDQLATKYKNGAQIDMELLGSLSDGPGTHDGSPRDQAKPRRQEPNDGASLLNSAFERESLERDSRDVLRDTLQTLGLEASAFQVWLRKSVRADCIYTAAGLALDCAGPILQDVLGSGVLISQKANWPAVYHTQRQYNLRLRGFDNLVPVITRSPISQMGAKTVRKTIKMMTRALKTPGRPTPESADQIITPSSTKRKRDTSDIPVEPPVLADFDDDDLAFLRVLFARVQAKISHRKKASEAAGLEGKMEQGGAGSSTVSKTPLEASSAAQPRHREWPEAQSANVANDEDQQKPRKKRRRLNGDADPGQ
ncbi:hypothetical protein B0A55_08580 [Friedmanniomyces simplex]|uniref:Heterokaryon incompatibility domain-containing protein n=1 Tax=Friedmanniomyces simplex TaxID=329884 RepID=A0A4U0X5N4_9PEZI|nr:hypothetical protein B0A55_08580 [Friedmanniomyces simplex]